MTAVPQKQKIGFSIDVSGNATVSGNTSGNATSGNAQ
jgi:hypothetical protein